MKIIKAEGYGKPKYAVAVAAALVAVTVSGCGVGYDGGISMGTPSDDEVRLAGEETLADPPVIDYDGGIEMYIEPDDELTLEGEATPVNPSDDEITVEDEETPVNPSDDRLRLEGGVSIDEDVESHKIPEFCEQIVEDLMLSGVVEVYEP